MMRSGNKEHSCQKNDWFILLRDFYDLKTATLWFGGLREKTRCGAAEVIIFLCFSSEIRSCLGIMTFSVLKWQHLRFLCSKFSALSTVCFISHLTWHRYDLMTTFHTHIRARLIKLFTCTIGECCIKFGKFYGMLHGARLWFAAGFTQHMCKSCKRLLIDCSLAWPLSSVLLICVYSHHTQ